MKPKKTFTYFLNAGIICDTFEKHFFRVQSENEGYKGTAPEKIIIAVNKNLTSPYQITKSYDKIDDWSSLSKVYGYCKTNKSVIIPLNSKLGNNGEKITERIKNNIMSKQSQGVQTAFSTFSKNRKETKNRLETIASSIGSME